ncbi:hypothetical protein HK103_001382 [Boothiomyces macroporosus]|uniref:Uncharacterized protein n=2 Tax=Boothiomyces macroporosus TaxID=261099 RepID=A0AAD5Y5A4_9FUNG|nr:hypothetical protein HK103_001382 [Boothiomyces macroporosus]
MRSATVFIAASSVLAWGNDGHSTIGNIAQHYLNEHAAAFVAYLFPEYNGVLGTYNVSLSIAMGDVPNWADKVKFTPEYSFSPNLHFSDSLDAPPKNCSYIDERDCPDNKCITGAIANYTRLASCDANTGKPKNPDLQKDAVRFLAHFAGDVTQPLHICNRSLGGNLIKPITFDGAQSKGKYSYNLHSLWDYYIPEKRINNDFGGDYKKFQDYLVNKIDTDSFDEKVSTFLSDKGIYDLTKVGNSAAAVDWAIDANLFDCSKVWGPVDADPKQDFGGKYYQDVYSTAEKQIAKGGYRLAHLLNEIFQDCQIPGQPAPATTTQAPTQAPGYTSAAPQTTTAAKGYQGNGPAAATTTATYGSKPIYSSALASSVSVLAVVAFVFAL